MPKRKARLAAEFPEEFIFYKWRGIKCIRLKGNTGRQGGAAKKQASILGRASAISASLRRAFLPILPAPLERKVLDRFNNSLQQMLRLDQMKGTEPIDKIPHITGYTFYGGKEVAGYLSNFHVKRKDDNGLLLEITEFDPSGCKGILSNGGQASLHIIVVSFPINEPANNRSSELVTEIPYTRDTFPGRTISLPLQTNPDCLTLVAFCTDGRNMSIAGALYN